MLSQNALCPEFSSIPGSPCGRHHIGCQSSIMNKHIATPSSVLIAHSKWYGESFLHHSDVNSHGTLLAPSVATSKGVYLQKGI
eukprot:15364528-Ditylum_brightwellii.AAC.1